MDAYMGEVMRVEREEPARWRARHAQGAEPASSSAAPSETREQAAARVAQELRVMEDDAKASRLRAEQALAEAQQAAEWKAKGWREQDEERMKDPVYQQYEARKKEAEDRQT